MMMQVFAATAMPTPGIVRKCIRIDFLLRKRGAYKSRRAGMRAPRTLSHKKRQTPRRLLLHGLPTWGLR